MIIQDYPQRYHALLRRYSEVMGTLELEFKRSRPECHELDFAQQIVLPAIKFTDQISDIKVILDPLVGPQLITQFILEGKHEITSDIYYINLSCVFATCMIAAVHEDQYEQSQELLFKAAITLGSAISISRTMSVYVQEIYKSIRSAESNS